MAKVDRTRRTLHFNGNLTHYRMDSRTSCPSVIEMPASTKSKMLQGGLRGGDGTVMKARSLKEGRTAFAQATSCLARRMSGSGIFRQIRHAQPQILLQFYRDYYI